MDRKTDCHFDTRAIHEGIKDLPWQGATLPPIFQTSAHFHDSADSLSRTFTGQTDDHIYMRLSNPTNRFLENKLASLESGAAAVLTGSGMAAVNNACLTLLRSGDEFIASQSLFMSTYALFTNIFKKYNIDVKLVDPLDTRSLAQAISSKTRFIYLETITNPGMEVPDIKTIAEIAHAHNLPLIVDNTLASPWLFRPIECGADIVIHSTTKYFSGHGGALGGVVIDGGRFNWDQDKFSDFAPFVEQKGHLAFSHRLFKEYHVNFGTTPAPFHSYLTCIGLNTLGLRMERHMANTAAVASFLNNHPKVSWVNYPGFEDHPSNSMARQQFKDKGFGGMLTFGLKTEKDCFNLIDHLQIILNLANLGDCKTLIIHPYSSQYASFPQELKDQLADPGLLRLSVGIENSQDICNDFSKALERV